MVGVVHRVVRLLVVHTPPLDGSRLGPLIALESFGAGIGAVIAALALLLFLVAVHDEGGVAPPERLLDLLLGHLLLVRPQPRRLLVLLIRRRAARAGGRAGRASGAPCRQGRLARRLRRFILVGARRDLFAVGPRLLPPLLAPLALLGLPGLGLLSSLLLAPLGLARLSLSFLLVVLRVEHRTAKDLVPELGLRPELFDLLHHRGWDRVVEVLAAAGLPRLDDVAGGLKQMDVDPALHRSGARNTEGQGSRTMKGGEGEMQAERGSRDETDATET